MIVEISVCFHSRNTPLLPARWASDLPSKEPSMPLIPVVSLFLICTILHCLCSARNNISTSTSTTTTAATTTAMATTAITTTTTAIATSNTSLTTTATSWFKSWHNVYSWVAIAYYAVVWVCIYWLKGTHVTYVRIYVYLGIIKWWWNQI